MSDETPEATPEQGVGPGDVTPEVLDKGFMGESPDKTPNEEYTMEGQLGKSTVAPVGAVVGNAPEPETAEAMEAQPAEQPAEEPPVGAGPESE